MLNIFKLRKNFKKDKKLVDRSGLFDAKYYLKHYADAKVSNETPIDHFCKIGLKKDYKPNEEFNPAWYREYYEDVQDDTGYPFIHYIIYGLKEGRFQNELEKNKTLENTENAFNEDSYLKVNPEVTLEIQNKKFNDALEHFNLFGRLEVAKGERRLGVEFPLFSKNDYIEANEDIKAAVEHGSMDSPLEHFFESGYREYLNASRKLGGYYPFELTEELAQEIKSTFDDDGYLLANEDIKKLVDEGVIENGWEHFVRDGIQEVRDGKRGIYKNLPPISESDYVLFNHDVFDALKKGNISSPYKHFLLNGISEYLNGTRRITGNKIYRYFEPRITPEIKDEIEKFNNTPLISVVMPVYDVDPKWLKLAIGSLQKQWYTNWEICIADDASTKNEIKAYLNSLKDAKIKITMLDKNVNISAASNAALKLASGEYVALMDNDDELSSDAFYEVVKTINSEDAEFIYSDEDKLEMNGEYSEPHFKADYAPEMFLSQNYISHLSVIKKELIDKVGGWELGLEGAQDYDLYLKVLELTEKVYHIPKVLYHWRKIPGSTAAEFGDKSYAQDAGNVALKNAMKRRSIPAEVTNGKVSGTYRVKYKIIGEPLVSIVIPFKDKPEFLDMCINSILDKSTYQNYEIIGISNNSEEPETFAMMKSLEEKDNRISFYEYDVPFNYSDINNYAVSNYAKGEHVLLLNNDIEIISSGWIEAMLEFSQQEKIGAVGAKLYYPDDSIQHAGVIVGLGGVAGHSHKYFKKDNPGYFVRLQMAQNLSAVTAACLMVKKIIYDEVGGLNEEDLQIAFNDVDFCLRVQETGYRNVYTPYCEAYHHESVSRGAEDNPEKIKRFNKEVEYMKTRHKDILEGGDPYYNVNLTLEYENFEIK